MHHWYEQPLSVSPQDIVKANWVNMEGGIWEKSLFPGIIMKHSYSSPCPCNGTHDVREHDRPLLYFLTKLSFSRWKRKNSKIVFIWGRMTLSLNKINQFAFTAARYKVMDQAHCMESCQCRESTMEQKSVTSRHKLFLAVYCTKEHGRKMLATWEAYSSGSHKFAAHDLPSL